MGVLFLLLLIKIVAVVDAAPYATAERAAGITEAFFKVVYKSLAACFAFLSEKGPGLGR